MCYLCSNCTIYAVKAKHSSAQLIQKLGLRGSKIHGHASSFQQGPIQPVYISIFRANKKALISCTFTVQLICAIVFAYAKSGILMMQKLGSRGSKIHRHYANTPMQYTAIFHC